MIASDNNGGSDALRFSHARDIVELVVLTTDEPFLQTLREAVGAERRLWHVASADKVGNLLRAGEVGILVLDTQCVPTEAVVVMSQIKRRFPDLVLVVAGGRDDEASLAGLISSGVIYRFIHKPVSPGRAKLFSDAAVRKYLERQASVPDRFKPRRRFEITGRQVKAAAVAGLGLLVVGAGAWALMRRGRNPETAVASIPAPPSTAGLTPGGPPPGGTPPGGTAAAAERERLLSTAESALLEERLDAAAAAIAAARKDGVDDARLRFLAVQLVKSRERAKAAAAQAHGGSKSPSASPTAGDERVRQLLSLAAERIERGQLIEPAHDSARSYVAQALRLEPDTNATQAAKQSLALALLLEAHGSIDRRDFAHAAALLDAAVGIAAPPNLDSLRDQLARARVQAAAELSNRPPQEEASSVGTSPTEPTAVPRAPPAAAAAAATDTPTPAPTIVSASQLTVVKSVPPSYPRQAEVDRVEGWVELDFTVTTSGAVEDITVHGAKPAGVFNTAAMRALAQWRYKPVERDTRPVTQRARIRIRFTLAG